MKYSNAMFDSLKEALKNKNSGNDGGFKDFMKTEMGKTYIVRLLFNVKSPERTFFNYYHHLWDSVATNQKSSVLCPCTYGERCPVDEYRSKFYKQHNGDKVALESIKPIRRNENWLVNVFVIKDPTKPENEGQVKILRYGKQLAKIIENAISGDDAEDFGSKIFDLTEKGCNLRIKVEENEGGFPTYVASKFLSPSALEGSPGTDELYDQVKDLDKIFDTKTYDEIQAQFKTHWLGEEESEEKEEKPSKKKQSVDEDEDEDDSYSAPSSAKEGKVEASNASVQSKADQIDALLADL